MGLAVPVKENRTRLTVIGWLLLLLFCASAGSGFQARELRKDEAVKLAESAIARNGCSDLVPIKDRPKLSANQPGVTFKFLMKHELDCHAVRAGEGRVNGKPIWIIGFWRRERYHEMPMNSRDRLVLRIKTVAT